MARKHVPRLYIAATFTAGKPLVLTPADFHYLSHVMRLQTNHKVRVFNEHQGEWEATCQFNKREGTLELQRPLRPPLRLPLITLAFTPLKQTRLKMLIEKATELGVTHFQPLITAHTHQQPLNAQKLDLIAKEAAEQCERTCLPAWAEAATLQALVAKASPIIAAVEGEDLPTLATIAPQIHPTLLVGPEGGFSEEEKELLRNAPNVKSITLGPLILRAETAAIALLSQLKLLI